MTTGKKISDAYHWRTWVYDSQLCSRSSPPELFFARHWSICFLIMSNGVEQIVHVEARVYPPYLSSQVSLIPIIVPADSRH